MIATHASVPARVRKELVPPRAIAIGDVVLDFPFLRGEKERRRVSLVSASILSQFEKNKVRFTSMEDLYIFFTEHNFSLSKGNVKMGISRLKKALGATSTMVRIETIHGRGYKLRISA